MNVTFISGQPDLAALWGTLGGSGSHDVELTLWDSSRGEIIRAHAGLRKPLAVSSDGQLFACMGSIDGGDGGGFALRDMKSGAVVGTLPVPGPILTLAFSSDGRRLAAGVEIGPNDHGVVVWDVATRQIVCRALGHKAQVEHIALSPDGGQLAAVGFLADNDVILWDATDGHQITRFRKKGPVHAMAFNPRGDLLATSGDDHIALWDVKTGTTLRTISRQNGRPSEDFRYTTWGNGSRRRWCSTARVRWP